MSIRAADLEIRVGSVLGPQAGGRAEGREWLEAMFDQVAVGIALADLEGRLLEVNRRFAEILGYATPDELVGKGAPDLTHPDDLAETERQMRRLLDGESESYVSEKRYLRRDGAELWSRTTVTLIRDADNRPHRYLGVIQDITARKRAERALADGARRQASLFELTDRLHRAESLGAIYDAALDAILTALRCDRASVLLFDEAGVMRFVGWRGLSEAYREAVSGHSPWAPEDREARPITVDDLERADFPEPLKDVVRREGIGALVFVPLVSADRVIGKFMVYFDEPHAFTPEETDLSTTIARQLTFAIERRRADDLLRVRARQQQMTAQIGEYALRERDPWKVMEHAVRALAETLEVECCKVLELLPGGGELLLRAGVGWKPGLVGRAKLAADESTQAGYTLRAGSPIIVADFERERRCGPPPLLTDHGIVSGMSCVIRAEDHAPFGVLGVHSTRPKRFTEDDVTFLVAVANILGNAIHRDAAENALRRSEGLLRAVVETAVDGIVTIDERGVIRTVNPAAERIFGYPAEELVGRNVTVLMPEPYHSEHDGYLAHYLTTGRRKVIGIGREVQGRRRDGSVFPLELGVSETTVGSQRIFTGIIRDITQRKRTEEELRLHREHLQRLVAERTAELEESHRRLRLSERMASLGTLSAGLGHDMGNILVPMRVWIELLAQRANDPDTEQHLRSLHKSTEYLKALASGLRSLSLDPDDESATPQQTDLDEWWAEVHALYRASIPRSVALHPPEASALPPVRVPAHALTQAVFNLVQNAGDLMRDTSRAGNIWVEARRADEHTLALSVRDDGPGMSPDVRQRCMEPFFTTKARGRGTGLGLSIVYNIMSRYGGSVDLESELGRGALFTLRLPLAVGTQNARLAAALDITDPRAAAVARMLLTGTGFVQVPSPAHPDAALWVVDDSVPAHDVRRFLARAPHRRVVRVGPDAGHGPGIECVPQLKPSDLRAALERAGRDLKRHTT